MKQQIKFKQTEIGKIPEDWEVETIGNSIEINPKRDLKKGTNAKKISMQDLKEFNKKIQNSTFEEFKGGSKFKNGDTLMARITPCLENGKTAFVNILDKDEVGFGSTEFIVLCGKEEKTIDEFVYYLSISPKMRSEAIQSMTGTSGRQRVQNDLLSIKKIPIPPIQEQKSIAKILSDLDAKIELNNKMNKTLEAIGQALFNKWFVDIEENPETLEIKPLDKIAKFLNGLALQKYPAIIGEESLPVIKIRELKNGITDQTDRASLNLSQEYVVEDGDVLFSWSGSLELTIWVNGKGALNQHLFKVTSEEYPPYNTFTFLGTFTDLPLQ